MEVYEVFLFKLVLAFACDRSPPIPLFLQVLILMRHWSVSSSSPLDASSAWELKTGKMILPTIQFSCRSQVGFQLRLLPVSTTTTVLNSLQSSCFVIVHTCTVYCFDVEFHSPTEAYHAGFDVLLYICAYCLWIEKRFGFVCIGSLLFCLCFKRKRKVAP